MNISRDKKHFWACLSIFSLAFIVRILFDVFLQNTYPFYRYPSSDVQYYLQWAREINRSGWLGNQVFLGLPLYPYFLAILERIFLGNLSAVRLAHMCLGSINCVLIYGIARKIHSYRVALLAGIICALSFSLIYYDWLLMPPTLLVFLAGIIILVLLNNDRMRTRDWLYLGLLFGISILGDGKFLFFLIGVGIYLLVRSEKKKLNMIRTKLVPLFLGAFIIIALTGVRNFLVSGQWVWISAQSGLNFYYGNNPDAKGYFENPDSFRPTHAGQDIDQALVAQQSLGRAVSASDVSRFYQNKAINFITEHPLEWGKLLLKKTHLFLSESEYTFDLDLIFLRDVKLKWDANPYPLLFPLALLGMWAGRKNRQNDWLYLLLASQLVFVLIFYLLNRYRASIVPFFIIFESAGLFWLVEQMRQRRRLKTVIALVFVLSYTLVFNTRFIDAKDYHFLVFSKAGYVFEDNEKIPLAQQAYESALRLRPQDTSSLFNLGNTFVKQKKYADAEAAYKHVIALNPIHADAYFNLGVIYEKMHRWNNAEEAFHKVLALTPQSLDAHYHLGVIYSKTNQCDKARYHLELVAASNALPRSEINALLDACSP